MKSEGYGGRGALDYERCEFLRGVSAHDYRPTKPRHDRPRGKGPLVVRCGICGLYRDARENERRCECDFEAPQGWRQTSTGGWITDD